MATQLARTRADSSMRSPRVAESVSSYTVMRGRPGSAATRARRRWAGVGCAVLTQATITGAPDRATLVGDLPAGQQPGTRLGT